MVAKLHWSGGLNAIVTFISYFQGFKCLAFHGFFGLNLWNLEEETNFDVFVFCFFCYRVYWVDQ